MCHRFYCRLTLPALASRAQMIPTKIGQATGHFCSSYSSMRYKQCASVFIKQYDTKQSSTFFQTQMEHELFIYRMKSGEKQNHKIK